MHRIIVLVVAMCLLWSVDQRSGESSGSVPHPESGAAWVPYVAVVPPGKGPFSLIVALHGINGNEKHLVGPLKRAVQDAGLTDRYAILSLKSEGAGWEDVDHPRIRAAVAWACATWPIDQRRIYGWGYSHGAFRLGVFGHQAQTLFAGVVLLSGGVSPVRNADSKDPQLAWYIIHGDADATVSVDQGRRAAEVLSAASYPFIYHEIRGEGHGTAGSAAAAPYRVDAVRWLDRQRCAAVAPTAEAQAFLDATQEKIAAGKRVTPSQVLPGLLTIGGDPAQRVLVGLLADKSTAVQGAAAKAAGMCAANPELVACLAEIVRTGKGAAREAALMALADAAHWREAGAADALAAIIGDGDADRALRLAAIAALGRCVPLRLPCGNPDAAIFAPLITALADADVQIRAAAITALVGGNPDPSVEGVPGGFGYRPQADAAERAAAQARWMAWLGRP